MSDKAESSEAVEDSIRLSLSIANEITRLRDGSNNALRAAVNAIYFDDNSDYLPALWSVVRHLDPDVAEALDRDPRVAFVRVNPDLSNPPHGH